MSKPNLENLVGHEYADLFPQMSQDDLEILEADIERQGVIQPIILFEGKILDGRHRYWCWVNINERRGIEGKSLLMLPTEEFDPFQRGNPLDFVHSINYHRRHLSVSQRAALGVMYKQKLHAEEALKNALVGKPGDPVPKGAPYGERKTPWELANAKAAKMVGVSGRSLAYAERVLRDDPPLFERIRAGEITVWEANQEMSLKHERAGETYHTPLLDWNVTWYAESKKRRLGFKVVAHHTDPPINTLHVINLETGESRIISEKGLAAGCRRDADRYLEALIKKEKDIAESKD